MGERVLVVEDEADVGRLLVFNLGQAGFEAELVETGADALLAVSRFDPKVVILDLMLPDLPGIEVCKKLRASRNSSAVGVLMLTAMADDEHRITGLEAGADDYVVKPFNVQEVVLRVKALSRRISERDEAASESNDQPLRSGSLLLDPTTHRVEAAGHPIELRPLEFRLLATLMSEPGRVFSREELLSQVWGIDHPVNPRTVDVHIRRLRSNLGDAASAVETVPGFGYRCQKPE